MWVSRFEITGYEGRSWPCVAFLFFRSGIGHSGTSSWDVPSSWWPKVGNTSRATPYRRSRAKLEVFCRPSPHHFARFACGACVCSAEVRRSPPSWRSANPCIDGCQSTAVPCGILRPIWSSVYLKKFMAFQYQMGKIYTKHVGMLKQNVWKQWLTPFKLPATCRWVQNTTGNLPAAARLPEEPPYDAIRLEDCDSQQAFIRNLGVEWQTH